MDKHSIWVVSSPFVCDSESAAQLLGKASDLANQKHAEVTVISIGAADGEGFQKLFQYGADHVLYAEYSGGQKEEAADILKQMLDRYMPEMIIFPGDADGKYLASVCSTAFRAGLTADCIDITVDGSGEYIYSRAALNSSVIARIKCMNSPIQMCTVKHNVFMKKLQDICKNTDIQKFEYERNDVPVTAIQVLDKFMGKMDQGEIEWQTAKVLFCVGRGVSHPETVTKIKWIAEAYGAELAGTRAAVEENVIGKERQVGQSGVSVCPDIYIGLAVSGSSQHMVGIKNAKLVIAINKDERASIFQYADYKIIGDAEQIIDAWYKNIKQVFKTDIIL